MSQPLSHARCIVATEHGSRYLQQLCKHWTHKFAVQFDATQGSVDLNEDRLLRMTATEKALELQASAPVDSMAQFQHVIDSHIARFAFREELAFDWQPA